MGQIWVLVIIFEEMLTDIRRGIINHTYIYIPYTIRGRKYFWDFCDLLFLLLECVTYLQIGAYTMSFLPR